MRAILALGTRRGARRAASAPGRRSATRPSTWNPRQREVEAASEPDELRAALLAQAEEAFWESPRGRARAAKRAGQRWFQIELPVQETAWSWRTQLEQDWGSAGHTGEHGLALGEIEEEGWELVSAGWVHPETSPSGRGSLPGGRGGDIIGIYLFRTTEAAAPEDAPWLRAVEELDNDA